MKLTNTLKVTALIALFSFASCTPDTTLEEDFTQADADYEISNIDVDSKLSLEVLEEINAYRASIGLSALELQNTPTNLAAQHSDYMANSGEINHDNFGSRSDVLISQGALHVSENVAYGYANAQKVVKGWLNSPSHKEAIEGDFNFTGIAVVQDDRGIPFYTQIFIKQ